MAPSTLVPRLGAADPGAQLVVAQLLMSRCPERTRRRPAASTGNELLGIGRGEVLWEELDRRRLALHREFDAARGATAAGGLPWFARPQKLRENSSESP